MTHAWIVKKKLRKPGHIYRKHRSPECVMVRKYAGSYTRKKAKDVSGHEWCRRNGPCNQ